MAAAADLLAQAATFEDEGKGQQALDTYVRALGMAKENPAAVLFPMAKFLLRHGQHQVALDAFKRCHGLKSEVAEIERILLHAFYEPNKLVYKELYEKNLAVITANVKNPALVPQPFDTLRVRFMPYSETRFARFDAVDRSFLNDLDLDAEPKASADFFDGAIPLLQDMYCAATILDFKRRTDPGASRRRSLTPLYLAYDHPKLFLETCQVQDYTEVFEGGRVIFLFGRDQAAKHFGDTEAIFPTDCINTAQGPGSILEALQVARSTQVAAGEFSYLNLMLTFERQLSAPKSAS